LSDFYRSDKPDTALIDRDREVGRDQFDKYDIKDIVNKGRYYLAKILDQNGRITDTVLIDKLSRTVHFQNGKKR